ncbi:MAG TPA: hypothetical protein VGR10_06870, partial [Thermoleophilaceae bacterium]|nr:hypothetical protein [Thermoleophilaceae bacterium]
MSAEDREREEAAEESSGAGEPEAGSGAEAEDPEQESSPGAEDKADEESGAGPGEEPLAAGEPSRTRRRVSAETGAPRRGGRARRAPDGDVVVRAQAKYVRSAPRKARLVVE